MAEETERERRVFQLQMCEVLVYFKYNIILFVHLFINCKMKDIAFFLLCTISSYSTCSYWCPIIFLFFKFLMKVNEIKVKKGVELAQHLVEFYYAQVT